MRVPDGRGSVLRLRNGDVVVLALPPEDRRVGRSGRAPGRTPLPRRLTAEQRAEVRVAAARGRTLRDLAADYHVSHQTIANVVASSEPESSSLAAD